MSLPQPSVSTRYDALATQDDDVDVNEGLHEQTRLDQGAEPMEVSPPTDLSAHPTPTERELAGLRILKKHPTLLPATPQLLGLKQRERRDLFRCIQSCSQQPRALVEPTRLSEPLLQSVVDMATLLRLREVTTSPTGIFLALAIVQSLCDTDLEG